MRSILLSSPLLLAAVASAQEPAARVLLWHKLYVGMSAPDVVAQLNREGIKAEQAMVEGVPIARTKHAVRLYGSTGELVLGLTRHGLVSVGFEAKGQRGPFLDRLSKRVAADYGQPVRADYDQVWANAYTGGRHVDSRLWFARGPVRVALSYDVHCLAPGRQNWAWYFASLTFEDASRASPLPPPRPAPPKATC